MARLLEKRIEDASHDKAVWALLAGLVIVQIVAIWMLCSHQVAKAEQRAAAAHAGQAVTVAASNE